MEADRFRMPEGLRFVAVGAINTVIGYGLFVLFELAIGQSLGYLASLYLSYTLSTVIAFSLHRRFTFRVSGSGKVVMDFLRFVGVYVVSLLVNTIVLPLLVEGASFSPLVAQAMIVVVMTISTYFGHKFFSFRRSPSTGKGAN